MGEERVPTITQHWVVVVMGEEEQENREHLKTGLRAVLWDQCHAMQDLLNQVLNNCAFNVHISPVLPRSRPLRGRGGGGEERRLLCV